MKLRSAVLVVLISLTFMIPPLSKAHAGQGNPGQQMSVRAPVDTKILFSFMVASTTPDDGAIHVTGNNLTVEFNRPVDESTISKNSFKLSCNGSPVTNANVQAIAPNSPGNKAAIFWPLDTLPKGALCQATITTGLKDMNGQSLKQLHRWSFMTKPVDTAKMEACQNLYLKMIPLANEILHHNIPKMSLNSPQGGNLTCTPYPREMYDGEWPGGPLAEDLAHCSNSSPNPQPIEAGCQNPSAQNVWGKWYYFDLNPADIATMAVIANLPFNAQDTFLVCVKQGSVAQLAAWKDSCSQN